MKTIMCLESLSHSDDIKAFLDGTQAVAFAVAADKKERYQWIPKTTRHNGSKLSYNAADIRLLVAMDERHHQPSGPVLKKLWARLPAVSPRQT